MLELTDKALEHILLLDGRTRYSFSVKRIVDWEEAWGLYEDGWVMAEDDAGHSVFLLWPAKILAERCIEPGTNGEVAREIPLDELMSDLLPKLRDDGIGVGVFDITGSNDTPVVKPEDFLRDLTAEDSKYY